MSQTNKNEYSEKDDIGLLDYLISEFHTSPLEMVKFTFEMKVPLSIFMQIIRHRTANVNALSHRYTNIPQDDRFNPFYRGIRWQTKTKKQFSEYDNTDKETEQKVEDLVKR